MTGQNKTHGRQPERDAALAGEYVLGVLPFEERRAVESRLTNDPAFAALVAAWQTDLAVLDEHYAPEPLPPALQNRIEDRLFAGNARPTPRGLWDSLRFWRGLSMASILVALMLAAAVSGILPHPAGEAPELLVAELSGADTAIGLVASYDRAAGTISLVPAALAPNNGKSLELWLVPDEGAPVSMGLVPMTGGGISVGESIRNRLGPDALLAVSLEPAGGSPTGAPTGPVLVSGRFADL